jgi:hypothetical protein
LLYTVPFFGLPQTKWTLTSSNTVGSADGRSFLSAFVLAGSATLNIDLIVGAFLLVVTWVVIFTFTQCAAVFITFQLCPVTSDSLWSTPMKRAGLGWIVRYARIIVSFRNVVLWALFLSDAVTIISEPHVAWASTSDDAVVCAEFWSVLTTTKWASCSAVVPYLVAGALVILFFAFAQGASVVILLQLSASAADSLRGAAVKRAQVVGLELENVITLFLILH